METGSRYGVDAIVLDGKVSISDFSTRNVAVRISKFNIPTADPFSLRPRISADVRQH